MAHVCKESRNHPRPRDPHSRCNSWGGDCSPDPAVWWQSPRRCPALRQGIRRRWRPRRVQQGSKRVSTPSCRTILFFVCGILTGVSDQITRSYNCSYAPRQRSNDRNRESRRSAHGPHHWPDVLWNWSIFRMLLDQLARCAVSLRGDSKEHVANTLVRLDFSRSFI